MHYKIRHITEYVYPEAVTQCHNLAHMLPRDTSRQRVLQRQIKLNPYASDQNEHTDYFGNIEFHFEIQRHHKSLTIDVMSEVETFTLAHSPSLISCADAKQRLLVSSHAELLLSREFLLPSCLVPIISPIKDYAATSFADQRPLRESVVELTQRIFSDFIYSPKSTSISTPLLEVLETRKGVCQDFAHLQIACIRAMGFPARYVSGYIETLPPPGQKKLVGADATHAWVAVMIPGEGWLELDPTNGTLAGEQHVVTAWGRDFFDVTPLKGIVFGGGKEPRLNVSVDVSPLNLQMMN